MEADLARMGIDYRDRWHKDPAKRLTLRRLYVLVWKYPPLDGAVVTVTGGRRPWSPESHLLDELRMTLEAVMTGKGHKPKPHPDRPVAVAPPVSPERRKALAAARARRARRQRDIERGLIT